MVLLSTFLLPWRARLGGVEPEIDLALASEESTIDKLKGLTLGDMTKSQFMWRILHGSSCSPVPFGLRRELT
jgi:hypothetical protein